jgi:hypothetical protein
MKKSLKEWIVVLTLFLVFPATYAWLTDTKFKDISNILDDLLNAGIVSLAFWLVLFKIILKFLSVTDLEERYYLIPAFVVSMAICLYAHWHRGADIDILGILLSLVINYLVMFLVLILIWVRRSFAGS